MKSSCKWPIGCEAWRNRTKEIILRLSNKYYISFFFFPEAFVQGMNFDISKLVCSFKVPELERAPLTQVDNNLTAGQEVDEGYSSFQNKLTHGIPSLLAFHSGLFCLRFYHSALQHLRGMTQSSWATWGQPMFFSQNCQISIVSCSKKAAK